MSAEVNLVGIPGLPMVQAGDDLARLLLDGLEAAGLALEDGDVLVLAQKVVSKAEGRTVSLATVTPSPQAEELGQAVDKDPRLVELILRESQAVVRHKPGVLIVEDNRGLVLANAGIDHSNVRQKEPGAIGDNGEAKTDTVLLLPEDPDQSAAKLRGKLESASGRRLGVIICDSLGRAWRVGTLGIAIGSSGVPAVLDLRGQEDLFGVKLRTTDVGHADQVAAAASILMGQAAEGVPAVLVRGLTADPERARSSSAKDLVRPKQEDLFR